ncbi:microtubule associated protein [Colletotrichum asianum]
MSPPPRPPANGFITFVRKIYNPLGFKKGYNFTLFFITAGAMVGFILARLMFFDFKGIFCNPDYRSGALPGECYYYQSGTGRIGIIMHLAGVLPGGFLACLQFIPVIRHKAILFHRLNGYLVLLLSIVGIIGVFMIARRTFGGGVSMQTAVGGGSVMFLGALGLAIYNVKKLQIEQHRAWMLRAWVYAGFIITMRIISFLAARIVANTDPTYYEVKQCAVLDFIFRHNQTKVLGFYPDCGGFYSGEYPGLNVLVHANVDAHQPAEIAAGFAAVFGAGSWLALAIHAILVELYLHLTPAEAERLRRISYQRQLEAGMKNAGSAGLTAQRLGDAEPWLPPNELRRIEDNSTPSSDGDMREKRVSSP